MEAEMKLRHLCAAFLFLPLLGLSPISKAQEKPATKAEQKESGEAGWPVRVFQVKYADVNRLANVFSAFGVQVHRDENLKILSVRAPREILDAIDEALKRLDIPSPPDRNIDLTVYLLIGSLQGTPSDALPKDLEPVIKQLKTVFNYQGFRLLDTLLMRDREGEGGGVNGAVVLGVRDTPANPYSFRIGSATITSDGKERLIRINRLQFSLSTGGTSQVGVDTGIDIREGQKVVVGKANFGNSDNALILVLTAKLVE